MPKPRKEQRKHPRRKHGVGVNITQFGNIKAHPKVDHEVGLDIGTGGMMIVCTNKFGVGTPLQMTIVLPPDDDFHRQVNLKGKVAWVRQRRLYGKRQYQIGVKFTDIKTEDREALDRFAQGG